MKYLNRIFNRVKLLLGKKTADKILRGIKKKIAAEKLSPFLAVILVGGDSASKIYVSLKKKAAEKIGIGFKIFKFMETVSEKQIIEKIEAFNRDSSVSGIIVQLPLPKNLDAQKIINAISPRKDVDGFTPKNIELFLRGKERFFPVFPEAIFKLIESSGQKLNDKKALIIANSKLFGEMMKKTLERKKIFAEYILASALISTLSREERGTAEKIKKADILISAIGARGIIKGEMLKKGSIVIDGGIVKVGKKVFGDADFESAKKTVGFLTPVPGGVGPVTIACLLQNVYLAAKNK
ncbi:MAG: bifunctional 5,10-methylenetetrahydrofolate dehydrogenase/5,10-methenyltetrahydrofolate cyclohydrolase [bacterium]|nr:bifunctional 5,10-methylenetetrahydrofolate dehydrogenase/5,10-methenyltetrahydrofolate cyclohydrolase [bacterium]